MPPTFLLRFFSHLESNTNAPDHKYSIHEVLCMIITVFENQWIWDIFGHFQSVYDVDKKDLPKSKAKTSYWILLWEEALTSDKLESTESEVTKKSYSMTTRVIKTYHFKSITLFYLIRLFCFFDSLQLSIFTLSYCKHKKSFPLTI